MSGGSWLNSQYETNSNCYQTTFVTCLKCWKITTTKTGKRFFCSFLVQSKDRIAFQMWSCTDQTMCQQDKNEKKQKNLWKTKTMTITTTTSNWKAFFWCIAYFRIIVSNSSIENCLVFVTLLLNQWHDIYDAIVVFVT